MISKVKADQKYPKLRFAVIMLLSLPLLLNCKDNKNKLEHVWVNFDDSVVKQSPQKETDSTAYIRVAVSAMVSPQETFYQYNKILNYIEEKLNKKIVLVQKKKYREVNDLLKKNKIDLAFICSGAYVVGYADSAFNPLVIPVKNGQHFYQAYLIVNKNSNFKTFSDLKGKKFVFSDSLSNTGMFYPLKRLNDIHATKENFFSETYFSNAHDYSIELVSRKIVDGASVNSLIFDYMKANTPEKVKNVKVIEKSDWYGMPPVVVSKGINPKLKADLLSVFLNMDKDPEGRTILKSLMEDKYVTVSDTLYGSVRKVCPYNLDRK